VTNSVLQVFILVDRLFFYDAVQ